MALNPYTAVGHDGVTTTLLLSDADALARGFTPGRLTRVTLGVDSAAPAPSGPTPGSPPPSNVGLEMTPITVYGHSYTVDPGTACTAGGEFFKTLKARIGAPSVTTWGVGGSRMGQTVHDVLGNGGSGGSTSSKWVPGTKGIVVVDCMFNDYTNKTSTVDNTCLPLSTQQVDDFGDELRTVLATLAASAKVEAESGTTSGTWTTTTSVNYSNGSLIGTVVQNSYVDIAVTVGATGTLFAVIYANTPAIAAADVSFAIDGTVVKTALGSTILSASKVFGRGSVVNTVTPKLVKLTGLTAGAHTLRVMKTDAGAGKLYFDAVLILGSAPPPVYVLIDPPSKGGTGHPTDYPINAANRALLVPLAYAVAAEFPNVTMVDAQLRPQDLGPDGTHPNDRGMPRIATALQAAIAVNTYDPDLMYTTGTQ